MGSKVTLPKRTPGSGSHDATATHLKLTHFPPEIWRIITSYLKFDMLHSLLLVGDKNLTRILTTRKGVETVNLINSIYDGRSRFEPSDTSNAYTPTHLFRLIKNLQIFPALLSFSYWINDPNLSFGPFAKSGVIHLPKSVTSLKLTTPSAQVILNLLLGRDRDALPNLVTLVLEEFSNNMVSAPNLKVMPRTLTDLELFPMSVSELVDASEHLPPNLTRLSINSYSERITAPNFRPSAAQCHAKFPSSITDLHVREIELLPDSPTDPAWFLDLNHVQRFSAMFLSLESIPYLPKTITALSIAYAPEFELGPRTFSQLPNLTFFSYGVDPSRKPELDRFPVIPSLTELTTRSESVTSLLSWIDKPSLVAFRMKEAGISTDTLPKLTRLNMPFIKVKESVLKKMPPQIKILAVGDIILQGCHVPDGAKSINSITDLRKFFNPTSWPFTLILHAPSPLSTSSLVESVPDSLTSLLVPNSVSVFKLPPSLTAISHLRLEPGCIEYLPRTLTYLEALMDSDPIGHKLYVTSAELIHLPPNLRTLKHAAICLMSESIPSGDHQKLCLPGDAERNLQRRFPNCDMSTCHFDPFLVLSDMTSIETKSLVLEGGCCYYIPEDFCFDVLELNTLRMTITLDKSRKNMSSKLPNFPSTLTSLTISGAVADSFALKPPTRVWDDLKILHMYHSNMGFSQDSARYAAIERMTNLELLSVTDHSPWSKCPKITLPSHLQYHYMTEPSSTWVWSSKELQANELPFKNLVLAPFD